MVYYELQITIIWNPLTDFIGYPLILLSLWGIIITSSICLCQTDLKSLTAYSSVSHIALCYPYPNTLKLYRSHSPNNCPWSHILCIVLPGKFKLLHPLVPHTQDTCPYQGNRQGVLGIHRNSAQLVTGGVGGWLLQVTPPAGRVTPRYFCLQGSQWDQLQPITMVMGSMADPLVLAFSYPSHFLAALLESGDDFLYQWCALESLFQGPTLGSPTQDRTKGKMKRTDWGALRNQEKPGRHPFFFSWWLIICQRRGSANTSPLAKSTLQFCFCQNCELRIAITCSDFMTNVYSKRISLKFFSPQFYWYVLTYRVSLVAQWWRTHLPMQKMRVRSLGQEDPVFLPGESHGLRGLVGCSPWGCNGLVMTYWLSMN